MIDVKNGGETSSVRRLLQIQLQSGQMAKPARSCDARGADGDVPEPHSRIICVERREAAMPKAL